MRRLWNEFKSFAMSGNMLDLALGFIIGAAFATMVESLADNVLMQFVAAIFGTPDFGTLYFTVNDGEDQVRRVPHRHHQLPDAGGRPVPDHQVHRLPGRRPGAGVRDAAVPVLPRADRAVSDRLQVLPPASWWTSFRRSPMPGADGGAEPAQVGLPVPIPGRRKGGKPQEAAAGGPVQEDRDRS